MIRSIREIEDLFQPIIVGLLNWEDQSNNVRMGWQTEGVPAFGIEDNMIFFTVSAVDSPVSFPYDATVFESSPDLAIQTSYTRVLEISFVAYGSDAVQNLTKLRFGFFKEATHHLLLKEQIFLVADVPAIRRVPENFEGRWWERADVKMQFNELVSDYEDIGSVESVDIEVWDRRGLQETINNNK